MRSAQAIDSLTEPILSTEADWIVYRLSMFTRTLMLEERTFRKVDVGNEVFIYKKILISVFHKCRCGSFTFLNIFFRSRRKKNRCKETRRCEIDNGEKDELKRGLSILGCFQTGNKNLFEGVWEKLARKLKNYEIKRLRHPSYLNERPMDSLKSNRIR